ncbi:hypothetical protein MB02_15095 [Croceicoccus estronivorus]|uniref:DsbA family protein n=1 Tax=Croceicoccus estronivorus TaxID=1172626 RepID=UPI00082EC5A6|nr:thioredoxin domain-containing protein [Croceicoccus estronivorus]OCC22740.1 hypothetical protein MB02_15095 [Croceicoccus estronivorus]
MKILPKALTFCALAAVALLSVAATHPSWLTYVAKTDAGGYRMGNPDAKIALMEFVSYTCPHCAHFQKEADGAIQLAYVNPGLVSVEVRHVIRNPVDLAAALLAECGPKDKFFGNHAAILRNQDEWLPRVTSASSATQVRWRSGPMGQRMRAIASDVGFYDIMTKRGYDRVAANRCLSDDAAARRIATQSEAGADALGVTGTPSFAIDGVLLSGTHTWDTLQPQIAARL